MGWAGQDIQDLLSSVSDPGALCLPPASTKLAGHSVLVSRGHLDPSPHISAPQVCEEDSAPSRRPGALRRLSQVLKPRAGCKKCPARRARPLSGLSVPASLCGTRGTAHGVSWVRQVQAPGSG